jgi:HSP20 family molecular chaperone IbpA
MGAGSFAVKGRTMKPSRAYPDLGTIFDDLFNAAHEFRSEFQKSFNEFSGRGYPGERFFNENTDYYPGFSYPPMNVYLTGDRSLAFEFALAGFDERKISLSFQGDYMIFSARIGNEDKETEGPETFRYLKRRLKLKDIEPQKYYVPLDKYDQEGVTAVFKNGVLRVRVPPRAEPEHSEEIKIEIIVTVHRHNYEKEYNLGLQQ